MSEKESDFVFLLYDPSDGLPRRRPRIKISQIAKICAITELIFRSKSLLYERCTAGRRGNDTGLRKQETDLEETR
jgi:hypothetical protein